MAKTKRVPKVNDMITHLGWLLVYHKVVAVLDDTLWYELPGSKVRVKCSIVLPWPLEWKFQDEPL